MHNDDLDDDLTHSEQLRLYEEAFLSLDNEEHQYSLQRANGKWEKTLKIYSLAFRDEQNLPPVHGDSIIMSPDVLDELTKSEVEFPLLFQVTNGERHVYCRCLEFTAQKGLCYFPHWLMEDLGVNNGDRAIFTHTKLPKATYAKLKPTSGDYLKWTNKKAVLEATLTNFATMSVGNTLVIDFNGKEYQFDVVELKPSNAVCIINSDVEVDFVEEANGFQIAENHEIERKNEPEEPIIQNNNHNNNNKNNNNNNNNNNQNPQRRRERERERDNKNTSKPNLFTGQGFSLKDTPTTTTTPTPTPTTNGVSNINIINNNRNDINNNPNNANNNSNRLISNDNLKNNNNNNNNNINTVTSQTVNNNVSQIVNNTETKEEDNPDNTICKNCGKSIPKASALLHEPYCFRNNYKCPKCDLVMNKATKDQHEAEFHSDIPCELCSEPIERSKMNEHLATCPKQKIKCNYCELTYPLSDIEEHIEICSSRTEKCENCGKYILLRDFELHFTSNCTYPSSNERTPSWEKNDLRKSLIFCEDCFAPFYEFEEYQMHLAIQLDQLNSILTTDNTPYDEIFSVVSHKTVFGSLDERGIFILITKIIDTFPEKENAQALEKFTNFLQSNLIDLTAKSESSQNFLHAVARSGKKELIPLFLNAGLDLNQVDTDGNTPFHIAALHGKDECLAAFIDRVDANAVNFLGYSALDFAIEQMYESTVKWLISNGVRFGNVEVGEEKLDFLIPSISELLTLSALGFLGEESKVISNIMHILQYFSENQLEILRPKFNQAYNEYDDTRELYGGVSPTAVNRDRKKFEKFKVYNSGALEFEMIFHFPKDSGITVSENHQKVLKKKDRSIHVLPGHSREDQQTVLLLQMRGTPEHCAGRSFFDFVLLRPSFDN